MRAYVLLVLLLANFGQPLSPQESIIDVAYSDVIYRCPTQLYFNLLCCPLSPFQPTLDGVGANMALILLFVMGALTIPLAAVKRKCSPYCRAAINVVYDSMASFPPLLKKRLSLLLILYAARVVGMLLIMSGDVEQNPGPTNLYVKPTMMELSEVVTRTQVYWEELAYTLNFENYEVAAIERNNSTIMDRCRDMLRKWLEGQGSRAPRTWSTLLQALRDIEQTKFAEELHLKLTGTRGAQLEGPPLSTPVPSSDSPGQKLSTGIAEPPTATLSEEDSLTVRKALLTLRPQWRNIGLALGIPIFKLNEYTGTDRDKMDMMLLDWLNHSFSTPTWRALVTALREPIVAHGIPVADEIEAEYGGGQSPYTTGVELDIRPNIWELSEEIDRKPTILELSEVVTRTLGQWEELASALYFENSEVEAIERNNSTMVDRCIDMLRKWLEGQGSRGPRTWSTLLQALMEIGQIRLAAELQLQLTRAKGAQLEERSVRRRRCGECEGCLAEECGECRNCLDMPKYGGPGKRNKACMLRQCERLKGGKAEISDEDTASKSEQMDSMSESDHETETPEEDRPQKRGRKDLRRKSSSEDESPEKTLPIETPGHDAIDPEFYRLFEEAMKEGSIKARIVKCLFIGVAGSGKTSTIYLLFGWDPPKKRHSTDCIHPIRAVSCHKVHKVGDDWEKFELRSLLANDIHSHSTGSLEALGDISATDELTTDKPLREVVTETTDKSLREVVTETTDKSLREVVTETTDKPMSMVVSETVGASTSEASTTVGPTPYSANISETVRAVAKAMREGVVDGMKLRDVKWIHLIDSGGQSQFQQVLSAFLKDVSACVFVMKLSEELTDHPWMEMYSDGNECGPPCPSPLTNEEIFRSCIQTVQSLPYTTGEKKCPKTIVVGTHQDKETPGTREGKNKRLLEILCPTRQSSFHDNLVYAKKEVIFAVNAKSPVKTDTDIAKVLRGEIANINPPVQDIPHRWYGLMLGIEFFSEKEGRKIVRLDECLAIGSGLHFPSNEDVKAALKHLDSLNMILYYPEVLPDIVFANPSVLLDRVRELVQKSYLYKGHYSSDELQGEEGKWSRFCNKGIITYDILEEFPSHKRDSEHLTSQQLVQLFEHLLIIAPISATEFFMPALLDLLKREKIVRPTSKYASAYVIYFPNGYAPCGLFSALVACLRSSWKFATDKPLTGNRVTFDLLSIYDAYVTLLDFGSYFEVYVDIKAPPPPPPPPPPLHCISLCKTVCPAIREAIKYGLEQAIIARNFKGVLKLDEAIPCRCEKASSSPHPAIVRMKIPPYWRCTQNSDIYADLNSEELVWFPKVASELSLLPQAKEQESDTTPSEPSSQDRDQEHDSTEPPAKKLKVTTSAEPASPPQGTPMYTDDEKDRIIKEKNLHVRPRTGTSLCNTLEEFAKEVVIIIQTVNENEFWAAVNHMGPPLSDDGNPLHSDSNGKPLKTCVIFPRAASHVGIFGGYKAALVQTEMGDDCRDNIEDSLQYFRKAKAIIGIGVAYGMSREKCKFGDVLVSKFIQDGSTVKFAKDGSIIQRSQTVEVSQKLRDVFCKASNFAVGFKCTKGKEGRCPKIIPGIIVSMSWLVDNDETKRKILENSPEAVGGEMEGYVLTKVQKKLANQKQPRQLGVIIIKGVADYADGKKEKGWQFTAAMAAVGYAHHQLEKNPGEFETDPMR